MSNEARNEQEIPCKRAALTGDERTSAHGNQLKPLASAAKINEAIMLLRSLGVPMAKCVARRPSSSAAGSMTHTMTAVSPPWSGMAQALGNGAGQPCGHDGVDGFNGCCLGRSRATGTQVERKEDAGMQHGRDGTGLPVPVGQHTERMAHHGAERAAERDGNGGDGRKGWGRHDSTLIAKGSGLGACSVNQAACNADPKRLKPVFRRSGWHRRSSVQIEQRSRHEDACGSARLFRMRVAFLPDSFHEVNGVAHTSRNFTAYAQRQAHPFLCVRAGTRTPALQQDGSVTSLELPRSRVSVAIEKDLSFDPLFWRHGRVVNAVLRHFKPDVIHITGPSELGMFGAWFAWRHGVALAASWHTNVHEYAARRMGWLGARGGRAVEATTLEATSRFYRLAKVAVRAE